jgi:hypothetical protein
VAGADRRVDERDSRRRDPVLLAFTLMEVTAFVAWPAVQQCRGGPRRPHNPLVASQPPDHFRRRRFDSGPGRTRKYGFGRRVADYPIDVSPDTQPLDRVAKGRGCQQTPWPRTPPDAPPQILRAIFHESNANGWHAGLISQRRRVGDS